MVSVMGSRLQFTTLFRSLIPSFLIEKQDLLPKMHFYNENLHKEMQNQFLHLFRLSKLQNYCQLDEGCCLYFKTF